MRNICESRAKAEHDRLYPAVQTNGSANPALANGAPSGTNNGQRMPLEHHESEFRMINTTTEVFDAAMENEVKIFPQSKFSKTTVAERLTSKGLLAPITPLGKILYRAALLSEAIDNYQEQEMLKTYLYNDPPFHPRRTLDQSYYWTLKTTKKRDRDQVVYRGTAPNKDFMHSGLHHEPGHCQHCWRDIRKVPRVIMVDQLWLWILDGSKYLVFVLGSFIIVS